MEDHHYVSRMCFSFRMLYWDHTIKEMWHWLLEGGAWISKLFPFSSILDLSKPSSFLVASYPLHIAAFLYSSIHFLPRGLNPLSSLFYIGSIFCAMTL
mgnify:CR=1 FL=1